MKTESAAWDTLRFRCIGPPRGGRVVAAAGHPTDKNVFYFGAVAGGVWKTVDGGHYWENITDGQFDVSSVGAIAVSEADPNVIYAGTGESTIRLDVSWGDGVYKSTDGGETWKNVGLRDSHHIGEIRIHPQDPDTVYAAALGHAFGPNNERGVYRSTDGGETWERVLYVSDGAGAVDLTLDVTNPRIIYASIWQVHRHFWELVSGGPDSGLWKSTDGGDSWTDISRNPGLPQEGILGKTGISVSPAQPSRVWAIVEAEGEKSGVYRSDDRGATWEHLTNNQDLLNRPWYYLHIFADPQDPDTVYVNNLKMWKSIDGGTNWSEITTPHGDNHDLWIDPADPDRMINGNDGGACVSFNGGETWSTIYNQLTGQYYHLDVDNQQPYHVYGTQQDNSSIAVPSATEKGAIPWGDCYPAGTGESGYIAVKPDDSDIVYVGAVGSSPGGGGALQRYDHRTKQIRLVTVWPEPFSGFGPKEMKYRFPWTFPILFSPHDTNVLYTCGNHVFRTTDEGSSWEILSPDLTRNDESKLEASGGPLTLDTSGAEHYCTISTFIESAHQKGLFWAGSDDGLIHISEDGGGSWRDVTPPDLPEWSFVTVIEPSAHDPSTVYVAATRYKLDDYSPYLFKTTDLGQSWQRLDAGFPQKEITRMLRADPEREGLLYVGTESGIFVSFDDGGSWQRMPGNLPVAPVYDMIVKEGDLVVATHGRSFWVLDDLTPLRQVGSLKDADEGEARLFPPRETLRRWLPWTVSGARGDARNYALAFGQLITFRDEEDDTGGSTRRVLDGGENPPHGAIVYYTLPDDTEEVSLAFLDAAGNEIRSYGPKPAKEEMEKEKEEVPSIQYIPTNAGLNRFVWNMRYADAEQLPGDPFTEKSVTGATAPPGTYQVRLTVDGESQTEQFELYIDPKLDRSQASMQAQFDLWQEVNAKLSETHQAVKRLRRTRERVTAMAEMVAESEADGQAKSAVKERADQIGEQLGEVEAQLVQPEAKVAFDRLRLQTMLNAKLHNLISVISAADDAPTKQTYDVFGALCTQVDAQLDILESILGESVADFNAAVQAADVPPVVV
ncbi:MAG: glycosyl hydrolase [Caldilineaceae bacterium]|nr:glycosyl hydrolase [Caldilineaceae bacterium]